MAGKNQKDLICLTGEFLKWRREYINMSRATLAMKIGTTYETIRLYEEGKRVMKIDRLYALLEALDVPLSELPASIREISFDPIRLSLEIGKPDTSDCRTLMQMVVNRSVES